MNEERPRNKIRVLDPATVNRIAAGEVVERPSSVVKELVENAIDADARMIRIEITSRSGVISSIRVVDNGCGMSPEDARLAFTAHATSKISDADDIDRIGTFGFRGEALSSIAAVSRVTLLTRERGSGAGSGTKVVIVGGQVGECGDTGVPEGTNILVEDLYSMIPARKKFLKSLPTEIAHIAGVVEGIALARPDIAFRLLHNGRELIATEPTGQQIDAIDRIFGPDVITSMVPVHCEHPLVTIAGYISVPALVRKNPDRILVAINRRPVSSLAVTNAILEGYGTLLFKGRYPLASISLTIDTHSVDVNVHPAKKIVKLSREGQVREIVRDAVRTALRSANLIPSAAVTPKDMERVKVPAGSRYDHIPASPAGVSEPTHEGTMTTERQLRQTELAVGSDAERENIPAMELIGQFGGIYLLAATAGGDLFIIDQHAAHERILYEQVSAKTTEAPLSQELIVPVVLERSARDAATIRRFLPDLAQEGFAITEFGRNSFIVSAIPVILGKTEEAAGLLADIVDDLSHEDLKNPVTRREQITRIIACRGAIKAGTVCTGDQCRRLLQQLARARDPFTCPHGRPTIIRFSRGELDAMFRRT